MSGAQYDTLVVGVGSPHGDDQLGWLAADALEAALLALRAAAPNAPNTPLDARPLDASGWRVRRAATPSDLLDWLPGPQRLILIDACVEPDGGVERAGDAESGEAAASGVRRLAVDSLARTTLRSSTGHLIGLLDVLELVRTLGRSPERMEIWTAPGRTFSAGAGPGEPARQAAAEIARRLIAEAVAGTEAAETGTAAAGTNGERADDSAARGAGRA